MDTEKAASLKRLLLETRHLSLAVLVDGAPYAGLLPFAVRPDFGGFLIHASALAHHTRGLTDGAPFALVIHEADRPDLDPLQLPRVTLQGKVRMLAKGSEAYAEGRAAYQARFPGSAQTFGLGDFNLFDLLPERGRYVTGFAGSSNIGPETLRKLADEDAGPDP